MLQPDPDTPGQSRKTTAQETLKTAYISEISRQGSTYPESLDLPYKEEVAGSNPASPTLKKQFCRENAKYEKGPDENSVLFDTTGSYPRTSPMASAASPPMPGSMWP